MTRLVSLLLAATGCASVPGATEAQLQRRATLDLGCPGAYQQHTRLDA